MNTNIYEKASDNLLSLVQQVWASEEAMAEWCKSHVYVDLDRTSRAFLLVGKVVDTAIQNAGIPSGSITPVDRLQTLKSLAPKLNDFNLFSQLILNIKPGTPGFNEEKMQEEMTAAEGRYKDIADSPFAKKAKFKTGAEDEGDFNATLALAKNFKILSAMQRGATSFRVTPIGKTPALADLNNLSNLSLQSLLPYLKGSELYTFHTDKVLDHIHFVETENGAMADGLRFPIRSESGGDIVKKAIAARYLTCEILKEDGVLNLVPRYESLLVTGSSSSLDHLLTIGLLEKYDGLGKRN